MPIYVYRCTQCEVDHELLQQLGAGAPAEGCPSCGGTLRKRIARVAVKYESWGFSSTDSLVRDPGSKDFKALRDRADRIAEGGT